MPNLVNVLLNLFVNENLMILRIFLPLLLYLLRFLKKLGDGSDSLIYVNTVPGIILGQLPKLVGL